LQFLYLSVIPSGRGVIFVRVDSLDVTKRKIINDWKGRKLMGILAWIILGLIAGAIAKAIYPGHQGGGIFATIGLGILGALVGGYLGNLLLGSSGGALAGAITVPSILFAVLGAIILIFIWGLLTRRAI
jgi:uncharacterized membrane protein YeaQ/YmgE (transglycosylase-associated protein family)